MSRFSDDTPIHETADFAVYVGTMHVDKDDEIPATGYLLVNKGTGVVEAQGTLEYNAIMTMRMLQTELEAAREGKEVAETEEVSFESVLQRLTDRGGDQE